MHSVYPALLLSACLFTTGIPAHAGPYSERESNPTNPHDPPVAADDTRIVNWATSVIDYSPAPGVLTGFNTATQALGTATDTGTVSLGDLFSTASPPPVGVLIDFGPPVAYTGDPNDPTDDYGFIGIDAPGSITLAVSIPITDGPGHDFVVFENGFSSFSDNKVFAELAYVEVSTNGIDFVRFESISNVCESGCDAARDLDIGFGRDFAALDPTEVFNLAGKHAGGWGTPFDLADLAGEPSTGASLVAMADINFIRIVDIPGNGGSLDSTGGPIFDSWVGVGSGGFDLNAIGVINQVVPEPAHLIPIVLLCLGMTTRYGRPTTGPCGG